MGFIARIFSPPSPPSQPAPPPPPPAPVAAPAAAPAAASGQDRLRGSAARRRGSSTILTDTQSLLGATTGKTLLGA